MIFKVFYEWVLRKITAKESFAILYDDLMSSDEIEKYIMSIKKISKSKTLDWGFCAGRCLLSTKEHKLIPIIANNILASGKRLYVNDGCGVTLNPGMKWDREHIETEIIDSYNEFVERNILDLWHKVSSNILYEKDYWKSEKGRIFYKKFLENHATRRSTTQGEETMSLFNEFHKQDIHDICEWVDAGIFSGDLLEVCDINKFKEYLERWNRAVKEKIT